MLTPEAHAIAQRSVKLVHERAISMHYTMHDCAGDVLVSRLQWRLVVFIRRNTSPFLAEVFVAIDKGGVKSLVVVVRATFAVGHDGGATVHEQQTPFVFADAHHADPETTAVASEMDFAPVKPRAEVLLNAQAIAPGGTPVEALEVALVGPGLTKRAIVTGERFWTRGPLGLRPTAPRPFQRMPLAWHLAFGGADNSDDDPRKHRCELRNPIGAGFHVNARTLEGVALPCIEHPEHRLRAWSDRPEPIGFGPVSRFASMRLKYAGTYDQDWLENVRPFLPQNFDDRYFQAAPECQQFDGLRPGTEFVCINMSTEGRFAVRVPRLNVTAKFLLDDRKVIKTVRADTLILEPHERRIVLVGRTAMVLPRKFTRLREVEIESGGSLLVRSRDEGVHDAGKNRSIK